MPYVRGPMCRCSEEQGVLALAPEIGACVPGLGQVPAIAELAQLLVAVAVQRLEVAAALGQWCCVPQPGWMPRVVCTSRLRRCEWGRVVPKG